MIINIIKINAMATEIRSLPWLRIINTILILTKTTEIVRTETKNKTNATIASKIPETVVAVIVETKIIESSSDQIVETNVVNIIVRIVLTTEVTERIRSRRRHTPISEQMITELRSQGKRKLRKTNMKPIAIGKIMVEPPIIIKIRGIIEIIIGTYKT